MSSPAGGEDDSAWSKGGARFTRYFQCISSFSSQVLYLNIIAANGIANTSTLAKKLQIGASSV